VELRPEAWFGLLIIIYLNFNLAGRSRWNMFVIAFMSERDLSAAKSSHLSSHGPLEQTTAS
jgi:hypothetical protein